MKYILFLLAAITSVAQGAQYRITADFRGDVPPRRAMRDIKYPCDLSNAAGLSFDLLVDKLDEYSMFTFHYDCNGKWVGASMKPLVDGKWHRIEVKRPKFSDNSKLDWSKVGGFRVSGWRAGTNLTYMTLRDISVLPPAVIQKLSKEEKKLAAEKIANANRVALNRLANTPAPKGERRLIWAHRPIGIKGKDWDYCVKLIKKGGFTDLVANLARGLRASYKSDVLTFGNVSEGRDCLEESLAACKRHGVKLHVWNCCWRTGWGTTKEELADLRLKGRLQVTDSGEKKDWLCPTHPENQRLLIESMVELARKGVHGIHFDYIRYPDGSYCFCDGCKNRFEKKIGATLSGWPKCLKKDKSLEKKWLEFRRDHITAPVVEVSKQVRRNYPNVEVSAAVFVSPLADWDWVGQDWPSWCEKGYVDFVCPMTYEDDLPAFIRRQRLHDMHVTKKVPRYPGIGLGVWPKDGLDTARFSEQITYLRNSGAKGFSVFELSPRFEKLMKEVSDKIDVKR